jgi:retinoid hydroxylase
MTELKSAEKMPRSMGLPLIGDTLELMASQGWTLTKQYERCGLVFRLRILGKNYAVLVGPEANRLILQDKVDCVSSYLGLQPFMEHVFGRPMMLQDGELHSQTRRLMAPAFHAKALVSYFETMQHIIEDSLKHWAIQDAIPLKVSLNQLTLQIGIRLLLGVQREDQVKQVENWYNTLVEGVFTILRVDLPFTKYGQSRTARCQLKAFLQTIIEERQSQGNVESSHDVLSMFLTSVDESGNALSTFQVIDELIHLINGAHFTTATALTWAVVELAARPEWRIKLQQELTEVTLEEPLNVGHLKRLNYMTYFLKEIERFYNPSGVVLLRGVVKEINYAGYRIPPGWTLIVAQGLTHRLPEIYTDPNSFDPERFAPHREEDKKLPFALIGFGGGEHVCIGMEFAKMEMKIFLATLLHHYDWKVSPDYSTITKAAVPPSVERKLQTQITPLRRLSV